MSDLFRALNNIRNLRAAAREASLEQLEAAAEKLAIVIEEKREAVQAEEIEKAKRLEGLNKYKELLEQDGISAEDLVVLLGGATEGKKRASRVVAPKYKFINEHGETKTWTGQGRMPYALKAQLDAGKTLADFAI